MIQSRLGILPVLLGVLLLAASINLYQDFKQRDKAIQTRERTVTAFRPFTNAVRSLYELEIFLLEGNRDETQYQIRRQMFEGSLTDISKPDNRPYFTDSTIESYDMASANWVNLQPHLDDFAENPTSEKLDEIRQSFEEIRRVLKRGSDSNIVDRASVVDEVEQRETELSRSVAVTIILLLLFLCSLSFSILYFRNQSNRAELKLQQAEETSRAKSQFLGSFSGQMTIPLDQAASLTILLNQGVFGNLTPEQEQASAEVLSNVDYLRSLMNDILTVSSLESRLISLVVAPIKIEQLMRDIAKTCSSILEKTTVVLSTEYAKDLPDFVCDPQKVQTILVRLVSHTARHTKNSTISLKVLREEKAYAFSISNGQPGESSLEFTLAERLAILCEGSIELHENAIVLKLPTIPTGDFIKSES